MVALAGMLDKSKAYSTTPVVPEPLEYILPVALPSAADTPIHFEAFDVEFIPDEVKLAGYASRLPPPEVMM